MSVTPKDQMSQFMGDDVAKKFGHVHFRVSAQPLHFVEENIRLCPMADLIKECHTERLRPEILRAANDPQRKMSVVRLKASRRPAMLTLEKGKVHLSAAQYFGRLTFSPGEADSVHLRIIKNRDHPTNIC